MVVKLLEHLGKARTRALRRKGHENLDAHKGLNSNSHWQGKISTHLVAKSLVRERDLTLLDSLLSSSLRDRRIKKGR